MQLTPEVIVSVAVPAAGFIVWLVRLEGRINLNDARYAEIKESLGRIEHKQDRVLGIRP